MENTNVINNTLFIKLIENSIFTNRQMQIILNIRNNEKRISDISSGAYYRESKQSKTKLKKLYYSVMLLYLLEIIDDNKLTTLNKITRQLKLIDYNHDERHTNDISRIANVIEEMVNKMIIM